MLVQKFGGTSVATPERIKLVAQIIASNPLGKKVIVVSAMAGVTDQLVSYTRELGPLMAKENFAEYDSIISAGEQITTGLLALALQQLGLKARSYLAWQIPIKTTDNHSKAKIDKIVLDKIVADLEKGIIPVVAGFQGLVNDRITTLGRGGSDTSAVALAAALKADFCDIYTDVDGIFNFDPRLVPKAEKIDFIDYDTCLEMASSGAKVIHPRAVALAKDYNIKVRILNSFSKNPGTLISNMEKTLIKAITVQKNLAQISLIGLEKDDFLKVFPSLIPLVDSFQEGSIRASHEQKIISDYSLLVNDDNLPRVEKILEKYDLIKRERLGKVILLGYALWEEPEITNKISLLLEKAIAVNNCDNRIEVLLEEKEIPPFVRALS
jgi:aspartate kinase